MMECYVRPDTGLDFNQQPYRGTFQQLLANNIGKNVRIDFQMGTGNTVTSYTGIIDAVGVQYVVLCQPGKNCYITGDIFMIKFITFICC